MFDTDIDNDTLSPGLHLSLTALVAVFRVTSVVIIMRPSYCETALRIEPVRPIYVTSGFICRVARTHSRYWKLIKFNMRLRHFGHIQ